MPSTTKFTIIQAFCINLACYDETLTYDKQSISSLICARYYIEITNLFGGNKSQICILVGNELVIIWVPSAVLMQKYILKIVLASVFQFSIVLKCGRCIVELMRGFVPK